jgi:hypothetical protein
VTIVGCQHNRSGRSSILSCAGPGGQPKVALGNLPKPAHSCRHAKSLNGADGSIPMSRNGEPVYSCFFQQSSFASFAVAPARTSSTPRRPAAFFTISLTSASPRSDFRLTVSDRLLALYIMK